MNSFHYENGVLHCENIDLTRLAARVGTPVYVYSRHTLRDHYDRFYQAFAALAPQICFAIKSCPNIHLVKTLVARGAGVDVVSGGELFRALAAGATPDKIVAAGVGKTEAELRQIIGAKVGWLNVESEQEFERAAGVAEALGQPLNAALRITPHVSDAKTPQKTTTGQKGSKFGVDIDRALAFFKAYGKSEHLRLRGLHVHIGSPIYSPEPYVKALTKTLHLVEELARAGFPITSLDIGGGFPADYDGHAPAWTTYAEQIVPLLAPFVAAGGQVIMEPGRTLVANSGVLLSSVQYLKQGGGKQFAILDAGMSQLIRPAMYDAYHFIWPARVSADQVPVGYAAEQSLPELTPIDVAGPICESSDFFARDRQLPQLKQGDLLCVFSAGAYGMSMASQYNASPRPAEILVDGQTATVVRRRETYEDLIAHERQTELIEL